MTKKEKAEVNNEAEIVAEELDLEELENVSGGSIRNVNFTKTVDISEDTKAKI